MIGTPRNFSGLGSGFFSHPLGNGLGLGLAREGLPAITVQRPQHLKQRHKRCELFLTRIETKILQSRFWTDNGSNAARLGILQRKIGATPAEG
jgi:hypothetical protein